MQYFIILCHYIKPYYLQAIVGCVDFAALYMSEMATQREWRIGATEIKFFFNMMFREAMGKASLEIMSAYTLEKAAEVYIQAIKYVLTESKR